MLITENGAAARDVVSKDGSVHDPRRIEHLSSYIAEMEAAAKDGAELIGYCCWSLLDNSEWQEGYAHRFGLVHVDFDTQERRMKDSAFWYQDHIAQFKDRFASKPPIEP